MYSVVPLWVGTIIELHAAGGSEVQYVGGIMPHVPLPHNIWFAMHLDSFGSNGLIGERSSHKDLQGFTSQFPMRCKGQDLCGDFGNYHWEGTKGKNGWNQPYLDK